MASLEMKWMLDRGTELRRSDREPAIELDPRI
jgi:hypothetical protein